MFSLTAVVALLTGNLEGPLATLAPTLLAVAVGLLLGRALAPATALRLAAAAASRPGRGRCRHRHRRTPAGGAPGPGDGGRGHRPARLLRRRDGHRPAQPAERRRAAQRRAVLAQSARQRQLNEVLAALAGGRPGPRAPDPRRDHHQTTGRPRRPRWPWTPRRSRGWPTSRCRGPAAATGTRSPRPPSTRSRSPARPSPGRWPPMASSSAGPGKDRVDDLSAQPSRCSTPTHSTLTAELSAIPLGDGSAAFSAPVPCADGCMVTGIAVSSPIGGRLKGTVVLRDLTVDGQPFSLGPPAAWRRQGDEARSVTPDADPAGNLGVDRVDHRSPAAGDAQRVGARAGPGPGDAAARTGMFTAPGPGDGRHDQRPGPCPACPARRPARGSWTWRGCCAGRSIRRGNVTVEVWSDDAAALSTRRDRAQEARGDPWAR